MFYTYSQNNSGGRWIDNERVTGFVIIEARSAEQANERAEEIGLYFDGDGDCPTCGNRWDEAYGPGTERPSIYGNTDLPAALRESYSTGKVYVYYMNGRKDTYQVDPEDEEAEDLEASLPDPPEVADVPVVAPTKIDM